MFPLFFGSAEYSQELVESLKSVGRQLQHGSNYSRESKSIVEDMISPFLSLLTPSKSRENTTFCLKAKELRYLRREAECSISK